MEAREARRPFRLEVEEFQLQLHEPLEPVLQCHAWDPPLVFDAPSDAEAELDVLDWAEVCHPALQLEERQLVLHSHPVLDCSDVLARPFWPRLVVAQLRVKVVELVQEWSLRQKCRSEQGVERVDAKRLRHDPRVCDEKEVCMAHQP